MQKIVDNLVLRELDYNSSWRRLRCSRQCGIWSTHVSNDVSNDVMIVKPMLIQTYFVKQN